MMKHQIPIEVLPPGFRTADAPKEDLADLEPLKEIIRRYLM